MNEQAVKEIERLAKDASARVVTVVNSEGDAVPVLLRPNGEGFMVAESLKSKLDEYLHVPERLKGTANAATLASFIDLVNRHKDGDSALFASIADDKPSLLAVVDYHTQGVPTEGGVKEASDARWAQHRISYKFPISPEWEAWRGLDAKPMSQSAWCAFIEDRIADIGSPYAQEKTDYEHLFQTKIAVPSELITLSRGMQISVESRVSETRVLQSGEMEVSYDEVHKDGQGQKLVIPGLFMVNIPLFVDGEKARLVARLRYRKAESKILWFYQFYRADLVLREILRGDFDKTVTATGLPGYEGSPEA